MVVVGPMPHNTPEQMLFFYFFVVQLRFIICRRNRTLHFLSVRRSRLWIPVRFAFSERYSNHDNFQKKQSNSWYRTQNEHQYLSYSRLSYSKLDNTIYRYLPCEYLLLANRTFPSVAGCCDVLLHFWSRLLHQPSPVVHHHNDDITTTKTQTSPPTTTVYCRVGCITWIGTCYCHGLVSSQQYKLSYSQEWRWWKYYFRYNRYQS